APIPVGVDLFGTASVPGWLRGAAAIGWRVVVTVGFAAVLAQLALALSTAVLAVLVGAIVAATFDPVVRALRDQRGWARGRAAAVASVLSLLCVLVTALLIVLAFVPYLGNVTQLATEGTDAVVRGLNDLHLPPPVVEAVSRITKDLQTAAPAAAQAIVG